MSQYRPVAKVGDVPPGEMKRIRVAGRTVVLYCVDGEFYATTDECSHDIASLSQGRLDGYVVTCPRHHARFDVRDGRHLCFPAVAPIRAYSVKVEGDDVLIDLS